MLKATNCTLYSPHDWIWLQDRVDLLLEGFRPGRERERDKAQLLSPTRQPESKGEAGSSSYHAPAPAQGPPPGPSNPAPQLPAWFPSIFHVNKHHFLLITRPGWCNNSLTVWSSFHRFFLIIWSHETSLGFHLITWLCETPLLPLVRVLFTSVPCVATWEYLLTDLSLFVIDFMNC